MVSPIEMKGPLENSGGAALAQYWAQQNLENLKEGRQSLFSADNAPSLIQALAYSNASDAQANSAIAKMQRDTIDFNQKQNTLSNLLGGNDVDRKTAQLQMAGVDGAVAGKTIEDLLGQHTEERKAKGLGVLQGELAKAYNEGISPEQTIPLVWHRLSQTEEGRQALADAHLTSPDDIKKIGEVMTDMLVNQQEGEIGPILHNAMYKMHQDLGTNQESIFRNLKNPEQVDAVMKNYVNQAAIEFSKNNPPPPGMSQDQWLARNIKGANDILSRFNNIQTGKKEKISNPWERMNLLNKIFNTGMEPYYKQEELRIKQQQADASTTSANASDYRAHHPQQIQFTPVNIDSLPENVKGAAQAADANHNGVIDSKGEYSWLNLFNNASKGNENTNTDTVKTETQGPTTRDASGNYKTTTSTHTEAVNTKSKIPQPSQAQLKKAASYGLHWNGKEFVH